MIVAAPDRKPFPLWIAQPPRSELRELQAGWYGSTSVTLDGVMANPAGVFQVTAPMIGQAETDVLRLEFYEGATGLFPLLGAINGNYATCLQCARLFEDVAPDGSIQRQYFQSSGQLEVDATTPPDAGTGELQVTITDLLLTEVTIAPDFTSIPVPGGACAESAGAVALTACIPACAGKDCGDDGCGGTCGACALGLTCTAAGVCQ